MKLALSLFLVVSLLVPPATGAADLLDQALATVGKSKADLGFRPKGYWNRYPYVIPYKLPAFDDLFAEPLRVYDYSYSMRAAVETYLADSAFWDISCSSLYQLSYHLAWERKVGGFRNYSANLIDTIASPTPLLTVLERVFLVGGDELDYRTFGKTADWPNLRLQVATITDSLEPELEMIIAVWLANLIEAYKYQKLAFRNVPARVVGELHRIDDLDATQGDGQKYYPQFDDCAAWLDWQSLVYASFKTIAAADIAAKRLAGLPSVSGNGSFQLDTPLGKVAVNGTDDDLIVAGDYLLLCDLGGNDQYRGGGGTSVAVPLATLVDLDGDDHYGDQDSRRQFGCGICGVAVCIDVAGDDEYQAERLALGAGIFGTGLLADFGGRDSYMLQVSGQGCGYFGVGLLIDLAGDDDYYLAGDGQGAGGVGGGIGILADYRGDDTYTAEPLTAVFDRGDYHSQHKINVNNAQGWGGGRRGDGSDGHSWAGGLGALIDCFGNDHYHSGNWSLGTGYWFGIGVLFDVNGDDLYESCYFTQASGAHFSIGALFDETGDDRHELFETAGAALSFGWDFSVTMLADWQGNDSYSARIISTALSQIRSNSFLFDFAGADLYRLNAGASGMGESSFRKSFKHQRPLIPFPTYAQSYGILIDAGGEDRYLDNTDSTALDQVRPGCANNSTWYRPSRNSENFGFDNYGIGVDADSGVVDELFIYFNKTGGN
jgi:hypothetical protein